MPYVYEFSLNNYARERTIRADYIGRQMIGCLDEEIKKYQETRSLLPQAGVKFKIDASGVEDIHSPVASELVRTLANYRTLPITINNPSKRVSFELRDTASNLRKETHGFNIRREKEGLELVLK